MCRRGGPRCTRHVLDRLKNREEKYNEVLQQYKNGEVGKDKLDSAKRAFNAACESYRSTTGYEKEMRKYAQQCKDSGDEKGYRDANEEANTARKRRFALRKAAQGDWIEIDNPITGQKTKITRFSCEHAANSRTAYYNGSESAVASSTNNLANPSNMRLVKMSRDEILKEARQNQEDLANLSKQYLVLKERKKAGKNVDKEISENRSKTRKARYDFDQCLAHTQGYDAILDGKFDDRDVSDISEAAVFDTKNSKGKMGKGVTIPRKHISDDHGYLPRRFKKGEIVPNSVHQTKFTTHYNGEIVDATVKTEIVKMGKKYYGVTRLTGKGAMFSSNNATEGYEVGELASKQLTSKGTFEKTVYSFETTSHKEARHLLYEENKKLSVDLTKEDGTIAPEDASNSCVGLALKTFGKYRHNRFRNGRIANPTVRTKQNSDIDDTYKKGD